ncbi:MAG: DUF805 domain-containing protein [Pseudomonadota bacterium]
MHDVFICYATKDKARVNKIVADLEREGLRCWIAPRDIGAGKNFQEEIITAIDRCSAMIVMLSRAMNESTECINEITVAKARGSACKLIPVRIQDVEPKGGYRYYLTSAQWVEHHADADGTVDSVFGTLGIERTSAGSLAREPSGHAESPSRGATPGKLISAEEPEAAVSGLPYAWNPAYLLFDWNGRLGRRMYLFGVLLHYLIWTPLSLGLSFITNPLARSPNIGQPMAIVVLFLFTSLIVFTSLALYAKRIHDMSRSAWKVLTISIGMGLLGVGFAIIVGIIDEPNNPVSVGLAVIALALLGIPFILGPLVLLIYPGSKEANQFGPAPSYSRNWQPYDPDLRVASASPEYDLSFLLLRRIGRISRLPFVMGMLFAAWLALFYAYTDYLAGGFNILTVLGGLPGSFGEYETFVVILGAIALMLCVYCLFTIISKRLHDLGQTSWWSVLIISLLFIIAMVVERSGDQFAAYGVAGQPERLLAIVVSLLLLTPLMALPGAKGFNRYGPPPGFRVEALRGAQLVPA